MESKEAGIREIQGIWQRELIFHLFGERVPDCPGFQANPCNNVEEAVRERGPDGIVRVAVTREQTSRHDIVQKALQGVGHKKLDPPNLAGRK